MTEVAEALVSISFSFCVTLVSSPDIAVEFVLIFELALFIDVVSEVIDELIAVISVSFDDTEDCSVLIAEELVAISPSAEVKSVCSDVTSD